MRVTLNAPARPDRQLPDVEVTAILATEPHPPAGEEPVEWLLLTNLVVETPEQAIEKLQWYLCRWQIEIFFRILKSGCRVEELQLEKLQRLEPALAFYMIIAWVRHEVARIFIRETCTKTGHTIGCSAARTLPGRASGVTLGCEAPGTL